MVHWLLTLELIDSPVLAIVGILQVVLVFAVLLMPPRRPGRLVAAAAIGAAAGIATTLIADANGVFDGSMPADAPAWIAVAFATAAVGVVGVCCRPWWRRVTAGALVLVSLLVGVLGVNWSFGLDHDAATVLGISALDARPLPPVVSDPPTDATLWQSWTPPAHLAAHGRVSVLSGDQAIPAPGYKPRDAALYLPPAALAPNPPKLPVLVFMMGQPGSPDPTALATVMDEFAARHHGLAPITLVVDQLTDSRLDPVCHDSTTYGAVSSYVNVSVPAYIRAHLNVTADPSGWVIGGYSNGGACALTFATQFPGTWRHLLDISGNEFPGSEAQQGAITSAFDGDAAAYEAAKPTSVMARTIAASPSAYAGHVAIFTHGSDDTKFGPGQVANAAATTSAGFTVREHVVPGAGHTGAVYPLGLAWAVDAIAPDLGLAPPAK